MIISNDPLLARLAKLSDQEIQSCTAIDIVIDKPLSKELVRVLVNSLHNLSTKATLSRLNLAICCQCDREVGKILADGLKPLHGLKNLALRVNNRPEVGPVALAKGTVLSLTRKTPQGGFPFHSLPSELRQKILALTDLVPDYNNLILWKTRGLMIRNGKLIPPKRSSCCQTCTNASDQTKECACWSRVGAYSTMCTCYEHPFALFRVSKILYEDSTYVCFSRNRFILASDTSAQNLAFLKNLPDAAPRVMRQLDLILNREQIRRISAEDGNSELADLEALVTFVSRKCNLSVLHFSLDTGFLNEDYGMLAEMGDDLKWLRATYQRIADALMPLKDVNRLEIYFSKFFEEEAAAEKKVKGESYDALARGKTYWSERWPLDPHFVFVPDKKQISGGDGK